MGTIYKKRWKDKKTGQVYESHTLWIKYYRQGKAYRESTKTDKKTVAAMLLKQREGDISQGKVPGIYFDKVLFDDLAKDFPTDYRNNNRDTLQKAERSVRYLGESFGGVRVTNISTDKINLYIEGRIKKGLSHASINRELAALKRTFHLGKQAKKVNEIPYIPMLAENNVRKGFFEFHEHSAIKEALSSYLKPVVSLAYHSGWRKEEILSRTVDKLDMNEGTIRLDSGKTKNGEGRVYYMNDEVKEDIGTALANRNPACPYLFQRDGEQIRDFRWAWESACIEAGLYKVLTDEEGKQTKVPTKLFHDYRRSADQGYG